MMASERFSANSDFSGTGDRRGNFVYDGANGPLLPQSAPAYVYDAIPERTKPGQTDRSLSPRLGAHVRVQAGRKRVVKTCRESASA